MVGSVGFASACLQRIRSECHWRRCGRNVHVVMTGNSTGCVFCGEGCGEGILCIEWPLVQCSADFDKDLVIKAVGALCEATANTRRGRKENPTVDCRCDTLSVAGGRRLCNLADACAQFMSVGGDGTAMTITSQQDTAQWRRQP